MPEISTRISTWGNAVYLHLTDTNGTEATIRLTAQQVRELEPILPELREAFQLWLGGVRIGDVRHQRRT